MEMKTEYRIKVFGDVYIAVKKGDRIKIVRIEKGKKEDQKKDQEDSGKEKKKGDFFE